MSAIVGITTDKKLVFSGAELFDLRCTHGLPLEIAIDMVFGKGMAIDWIGFVEAARRNKWWDFQTIEVVQYAIDETLLPKDERESYKKAVIDRIGLYVVRNRHPAMSEAA